MIACGKKEKQTTGKIISNVIISNDIIRIDTSSIAIIQFDTTHHWLFDNAKPTDLNQTDLKEIERILIACISNYNPEQKKQFEEFSTEYPNLYFQLTDFIIELEEYKRQYVPVINKNGEKEIWINCFCNTWDMNWRKELIIVDDGGNCYFRLKINLTKNEYYDFMVNGVA